MKLMPYAVFIVVFITHVRSPVTTASDSRWFLPVAASILRHGDPDISEYSERILEDGYVPLVGVDGGLYNHFPIGTPLMSLPLVFGINAYMNLVKGVSLEEYLRRNQAEGMERLIASFFVAVARGVPGGDRTAQIPPKLPVGDSVLTSDPHPFHGAQHRGLRVLPATLLQPLENQLRRLFPEALAANLFSPNRGLFVCSPILLMAFYGGWLLIRRKGFGLLEAALAASIFTHWIAISSFPHWWGGHSIGPRLFTDMVPFLVYFIVPAAAEVRSARGIRRGVIAVSLTVLSSVSFFIHFRGSCDPRVLEWNRSPSCVDSSPGRVWDWKDVHFLRW